jgi:hypothetical protein
MMVTTSRKRRWKRNKNRQEVRTRSIRWHITKLRTKNKLTRKFPRSLKSTQVNQPTRSNPKYFTIAMETELRSNRRRKSPHNQRDTSR